MIAQQAIVELLIVTGVTLGSAAALLVLRQTSLRALRTMARKTESRLDDLVLTAFRLPSLLWCIGLSIYVGLLRPRHACQDWATRH